MTGEMLATMQELEYRIRTGINKKYATLQEIDPSEHYRLKHDLEMKGTIQRLASMIDRCDHRLPGGAIANGCGRFRFCTICYKDL